MGGNRVNNNWGKHMNMGNHRLLFFFLLIVTLFHAPFLTADEGAVTKVKDKSIFVRFSSGHKVKVGQVLQIYTKNNKLLGSMKVLKVKGKMIGGRILKIKRVSPAVIKTAIARSGGGGSGGGRGVPQNRLNGGGGFGMNS